MASHREKLRTARLAMALLERIPRQRKVSASELHAQLADAGIVRNLRTVQRQLETLSTHYDIERDDSSKPYGYRWKENAKGFSLPVMGAQEALLFALAEQQLRDLLPAHLLRSMSAFFVQARRSLGPDRDARLEREWLGKVRVVGTSQPLLPPRIVAGVLDQVSQSLYSNCWLHVDYRNADGKRSKADVMPLGLAQQGPSLYLVCRFEGFENERSLALHRMVTATASTLTFARPKGFDLKAFDDEGRFGYGEGKRIRIRFDITKTAGFHLLETRLSEGQTVEDRGETYRVTAEVVDSAWFWKWVRGFGEEVTGLQVLPNRRPEAASTKRSLSA